jgi:putative intracellular protease/amidase
MAKARAILMVVTNQDKIDIERPTGLWLEEFTIAYQRFLEAGYHISVASPAGGAAAIDPLSRDAVDAEKHRGVIEMLQFTLPLARCSVRDFDAIYFAGGHGAKYDFPYHPEVDRMVSGFVQTGKVVAAVCHGPAALLGARLSNGTPLIKDRRVTAFTNEEARALNWVQDLPFLLKRTAQHWHIGIAERSIYPVIQASLYTNVMWFHLESKLRELGANFEVGPMWQDHVVIDHTMLTGQNPQSTNSLARAIIRVLESSR